MNIQEYSVALGTSSASKKNPTVIARELGVSQSTISRFVSELDLNEKDFAPMIKKLFGDKKLNLIIDDTTTNRRYSTEVEGISSMVDQSTKTFTNGYKIVTCGLTDDKYFVPIALEHWVAEFIMKDGYLSITKLAENLIKRVISLGISISSAIFDGLYFATEFINFLENTQLKFLIKAKTTTSVEYKGEQMQLRNCKDLRLNSNQRAKKILAKWHGQLYYFIAVRRSGKRGEKIIYLISNFKTKSHIYVKMYDSRWKIEKFHRTSKQSMGLRDCISTYAKTYLNHIKCVFFAYGLLQLLMKKLKLDSIEDAIREAQSMKQRLGFTQTAYTISLLENYA